jgi:hypothetical protein
VEKSQSNKKKFTKTEQDETHAHWERPTSSPIRERKL